MKNKLVEEILIALQKRFAMGKDESKKECINGSERKAFIRINGKIIPNGHNLVDGKKIEVIPRINNEYIPIFTINDSDRLEEALQEYLRAVREVDIKYTKMNDDHREKYFLLNVWKNATNYDFQNPESFISRYTDFIRDNTFSQYDELTFLGKYDNNMLMVQRKQDRSGFETPYIMHFSLTNGKDIYHLPWVRYGISKNEKGEKIAYIYALQNMEISSNEEYNRQIQSSINKVNSGVKNYRNVTPSAIATLSVFIGMLENEGIYSIRVPDFLIGRYKRFRSTNTEEDIDKIQRNVTDKFLRNFLRLSEQLDNLQLQGFDGFLWAKINKTKEASNKGTLEELYNLGKRKTLQSKAEETYER